MLLVKKHLLKWIFIKTHKCKTISRFNSHSRKSKKRVCYLYNYPQMKSNRLIVTLIRAKNRISRAGIVKKLWINTICLLSTLKAKIAKDHKMKIQKNHNKQLLIMETSIRMNTKINRYQTKTGIILMLKSTIMLKS